MADALTVPHAVAAIVLCIAGAAKLRAPGPAANALGAPRGLVRAFALYELALGAAAIVWPVLSPLLALTFVALACLTVALARRGASCGCFGERGDAPASAGQALLSIGLAVLAAAPAHDAGWLVHRGAATTLVLVLGILAAAYGTVVAYIQIASAWHAWSVP